MYDVFLGDKIVGKATVKQKGLYYEVVCRCTFLDQKKYRILTRCGDLCADLGLCVPCENGFGFTTLVKIRSIGQGNIYFYAIPAEREFVAVSADSPFCYLQRIRSGEFRVVDGQPGIIFPE